MMQLGHTNLETTQIYAAGVSERRRETVLSLDFSLADAEPRGV
jgi:site-specific recombinase XerD